MKQNTISLVWTSNIIPVNDQSRAMIVEALPLVGNLNLSIYKAVYLDTSG